MDIERSAASSTAAGKMKKENSAQTQSRSCFRVSHGLGFWDSNFREKVKKLEHVYRSTCQYPF